MRRSWKQKLMIGVAVAAVVAGVIVAVVSSGGTSHAPGSVARASSARGGRRGAIAVAASYLGLTGAQVRADLRAGKTLAEVADATSGKSAAGLVDALVKAKAASLYAAVADGKLPTARERARLTALRRRAAAKVNQPYEAEGGRASLSAATSYLGVTAKQIRGDERSGRSLAQIADATSGKTAAGLIDALVAARKANIAAAVASGRLSRASEQTLLSTLKKRVTAEVNRAPSRRASKQAASQSSHGQTSTPESEEGGAAEAKEP